MDERAAQVFTGLSVLVLLWIGVYWLWEPSTPRVSHGGETPGAIDHAPEPIVSEPEPTPVERREPEVIPPAFRSHTLNQNDTFESIAQEQFGDASKWDVIARANPLKDPTRLKPGQTIRVPLDEGNVQGVVNRPLERAAQPEYRTHIVRSGDTLSSIAQQYLGSSVKAAQVFELNRDRLRDMHSLSVGQELRLPPEG